MGRLHARLSGSTLDASIQQEVKNAERALRRALGVARTARLQGAASTRRVERDLSRALSTLSAVRSVVPLWDHGDPDLSLSALEAWRARHEQERLRREEEAGRLRQEAEAEVEVEPEPEVTDE